MSPTRTLDSENWHIVGNEGEPELATPGRKLLSVLTNDGDYAPTDDDEDVSALTYATGWDDGDGFSLIKLYDNGDVEAAFDLAAGEGATTLIMTLPAPYRPTEEVALADGETEVATVATDGTVTLSEDEELEGWADVGMVNWTAEPPPPTVLWTGGEARFYIDPFGVVHLGGYLTGDGQTTDDSLPLWTMPDGYLPDHDCYVAAGGLNSGLKVAMSGEVTVEKTDATNDGIWLDGVSYRAAYEQQG